jgi:hypothetical protein
MPDVGKTLDGLERFVIGRLRKGRPLRRFDAGDAAVQPIVDQALKRIEALDTLTPDAVRTVIAELRR